MTSHAYASASDRWTPLPIDQRQWEHAAPTAPGPTRRLSATTAPTPSSAAAESDVGDFAAEASYDGTVPLASRPLAPRIRPEHVWGVRDDWGKKAKGWGRGTGRTSDDGR